MLLVDDDRIDMNNGAGIYASVAQRQFMANTSGQDYIVPLHALFDQASISLLTDSNQVQLRVYMKNLS